MRGTSPRMTEYVSVSPITDSGYLVTFSERAGVAVLRPGISDKERMALSRAVATRKHAPSKIAAESGRASDVIMRPRRPLASWLRHVRMLAYIGSFFFLSNRLALAVLGALNRRF